jgi:hypothetical protein
MQEQLGELLTRVLLWLGAAAAQQVQLALPQLLLQQVCLPPQHAQQQPAS